MASHGFTALPYIEMFPRGEACYGMRVANRTRLCVTLILAAGFVTLMPGCRSAGKRASLAAGATPDGTTQRSALKPLLRCFRSGPLARPKAFRQVGVPEGATCAAIPPDNPQTTEKIALGLRVFFDGRLSVEGDG
jgi:hypothetical protein